MSSETNRVTWSVDSERAKMEREELDRLLDILVGNLFSTSTQLSRGLGREDLAERGFKMVLEIRDNDEEFYKDLPAHIRDEHRKRFK